MVNVLSGPSSMVFSSDLYSLDDPLSQGVLPETVINRKGCAQTTLGRLQMQFIASTEGLPRGRSHCSLLRVELL